MKLHGGVVSTTTEVWEMLSASRDGDVDRVMQMVSRCPELSTRQHNYTPPLHFAVRGMAARWGQKDMAAFLLDRGADPRIAGASWATPLAWAQKKGHSGIAADLIAGGAAS